MTTKKKEITIREFLYKKGITDNFLISSLERNNMKKDSETNWKKYCENKNIDL